LTMNSVVIVFFALVSVGFSLPNTKEPLKKGRPYMSQNCLDEAQECYEEVAQIPQIDPKDRLYYNQLCYIDSTLLECLTVSLGECVDVDADPVLDLLRRDTVEHCSKRFIKDISKGKVRQPRAGFRGRTTTECGEKVDLCLKTAEDQPVPDPGSENFMQSICSTDEELIKCLSQDTVECSEGYLYELLTALREQHEASCSDIGQAF